MINKKSVQDKIISEHSVECGLCKEIFRGRTEKEADKNFQHHYLFKHVGVKR